MLCPLSPGHAHERESGTDREATPARRRPRQSREMILSRVVRISSHSHSGVPPGHHGSVDPAHGAGATSEARRTTAGALRVRPPPRERGSSRLPGVLSRVARDGRVRPREETPVVASVLRRGKRAPPTRGGVPGKSRRWAILPAWGDCSPPKPIGPRRRASPIIAGLKPNSAPIRHRQHSCLPTLPMGPDGGHAPPGRSGPGVSTSIARSHFLLRTGFLHGHWRRYRVPQRGDRRRPGTCTRCGVRTSDAGAARWYYTTASIRWPALRQLCPPCATVVAAVE